MAQKKFILAHTPYIFDSMTAVSTQLVTLAENGEDLSTYVIGVYLGSPEISTSVSVNIGGKVKRMNKSSIKRLPKQVVKPAQVENATVPEPTGTDSTDMENDGICSFCGKKWVRKTVLEGFNTYLCEYHLKLETQLAAITS